MSFLNRIVLVLWWLSGVDAAHRSLRGASVVSSSSFQSELLTAVNQERRKYGLPALCMNRKLLTAAQGHSVDMATHQFMSHTGSLGSTMVTRIKAQGFVYSALAENVAAGQATVQQVLSAWMNSSGHRANILSRSYRFFGAGYAYNSYGGGYKHYWTQDFGASAAETCM